MSKKKIKRPQQYKKPKDRTLKEWWQDQTEATKKKIMYICIAIVAVIALILIWYFGIYNDGSLKVKDNAAVGAQENWLIGQRSGGKNSHYYHLADVTAPEGYELTSINLNGSSDPRTDFTYTATTDKGEASIYVAPVSSSVSDMISGIYASFSSMTAENGSISEVKDYQDAKYFTYTMEYADDAGATTYHQSLVLYTPANYKDTCILVSVSPVTDSAESYWAEEDLLAEAAKTLDGITVAAK